MEALIVVIVLLVIAGVTALGRSMKVVQQYEKGVLYRFGRVQPEVVQPGLAFIRPVGDRMQKVNMQIDAMTVPAQDGITRDNVSVRGITARPERAQWPAEGRRSTGNCGASSTSRRGSRGASGSSGWKSRTC